MKKPPHSLCGGCFLWSVTLNHWRQWGNPQRASAEQLLDREPVMGRTVENGFSPLVVAPQPRSPPDLAPLR